MRAVCVASDNACMTTAAKPIDPSIMQRLAFVALLHQQGDQQAAGPAPMHIAGILTLHDAVELFLVLAGEHLGGGLSEKLDFLGYWAEIDKRFGVALTHKSSMSRLNRRRIDFKHHGNLPSTQSLASARADVASFLEGNIPLVFGIDYDRISMADLIPQHRTRHLVGKADRLEAQDRRTEAMAYLTYAFSELTTGPASAPVRQLLDLGPALQPRLGVELTQQALGGASAFDDRLAYQIYNATHATMRMQNGLQIIALGISYPEFVRFRTYAVGCHGPHADGPDDEVTPAAPEGYTATGEEYRFCLQFVVTASLKIAEIAELAIPAGSAP
jgi:hypothetical protein